MKETSQSLSSKSGWIARISYNYGMTINLVNGAVVVAISGGSSGATEPIWPNKYGYSVTDGTVIWQLLQEAYDPSIPVYNQPIYSLSGQVIGQSIKAKEAEPKEPKYEDPLFEEREV